MYVEQHSFPGPENLSINDLSRADLLKLYRALATVPISKEDSLYQLRDTIWRFLSDNQ